MSHFRVTPTRDDRSGAGECFVSLIVLIIPMIMLLLQNIISRYQNKSMLLPLLLWWFAVAYYSFLLLEVNRLCHNIRPGDTTHESVRLSFNEYFAKFNRRFKQFVYHHEVFQSLTCMVLQVHMYCLLCYCYYYNIDSLWSVCTVHTRRASNECIHGVWQFY